MTSIRFLGAAGTVTGSRFLVDTGSARVLVDAGDRRTRDAFRAWAIERRAQRQALFRSVGVDALELHTDRPYDVPLVRFFHLRARRMSR